jgi:hypothetical protein
MILVGDTGVVQDSPSMPRDAPVEDTFVPPMMDVVVDDRPTDVPTGNDSPTMPMPDAAAEACVPNCNGRVCGDDGCGAVCGVCGGGASCTPMGRCSFGGSAMWTLIAVQGEVAPLSPDGSAWDVGVNVEQRAPDPKVCVTIPGGGEECTPYVSNSIAPLWNFRYTRAVSTQSLMAGLRMRYLDDDTFSDDNICGPSMVVVAAAQVDAMRFEWRCTSGAVTFRLEAR